MSRYPPRWRRNLDVLFAEVAHLVPVDAVDFVVARRAPLTSARRNIPNKGLPPPDCVPLRSGVVAISEGAWALIGVVSGGVLAGGLQFGTAVLQRLWAVRDAKTAQEDRMRDAARVRADMDRERLFEHKKAAHLAFVASVGRLDDAETYVRLNAEAVLAERGSLDLVRLYGACGTPELAVVVFNRWLSIATRGFQLGVAAKRGLVSDEEEQEESDALERLREERDRLFRRYESSLRHDLGVDG